MKTILFFVLFLSIHSLQAQEWIGEAKGNQDNRWITGQAPNNWNPNTPPNTPGAEVLFSDGDDDLDGKIIDLRQDITIGSLTVENTTGANFVIGEGGKTLIFDKAGSASFNLTKTNTGVITITAPILVEAGNELEINISGGTLLLGDNHRFDSADASLTLSGGEFGTDGFSDVMGTLTLSGDSTVNMGSSDGSILDFDSAVRPRGGVLTISNWSGSILGGGNDQIRFENSPANKFLNNVYWEDQGILGARYLEGELVPIPEPTAYLSGILLFAFLALWHRGRGKNESLSTIF